MVNFHYSVPSSWQGYGWGKCLQNLWQSQDGIQEVLIYKCVFVAN